MRKRLAITTLLMMFLCVSLPCVKAFGSTEKKVDIFAKYEHTMSGCTTSKLVDGSGSVTLEELGITIKVENVSPKDIILVVMPILKSDTEAWKWFESMISSKGKKFMPFEIYFIDSSGAVVPLTKSMKVSITTPDDYSNPVIYHLLSDGTLNKLDSTKEGGFLTFTYNGEGYMVLLSAKSQENLKETEKKETEKKETEKKESEKYDSSSGKVPPTGDDNHMILWILLCCVGLSVCSVFAVKREYRSGI